MKRLQRKGMKKSRIDEVIQQCLSQGGIVLGQNQSKKKLDPIAASSDRTESLARLTKALAQRVN